MSAVISIGELLGEGPPKQKPQRPPRGMKSIKLFGKRFRCGQMRSLDRSKLIINKAGIEVQRSVHERKNYDKFNKHYPHSSHRQQDRELRRRINPIDINL
jgi:hypothetical protein